MSYSNKWTQEIRQTLSQVLSESKRPTKEDENILKRTQEKEQAEKKRWKDSIKGSGPKKYDEKAMDYALGVHGKYTYDHVEHDGEQLDELSKATYGSYIKKAAKDMQDRAYDATPIAGDPEHAKIAKRVKGIGRAVKALGKESTRSEEVEHEGNNIQEEMALNEDLLMLIDVLCEELGIDVEELLSEDYTTVGRAKELSDDILAAVGRGDNRAAEKHMNTLIRQGSDPKNVYGKGGKVLKKAAGFRRVPGAKKKTNKSK